MDQRFSTERKRTERSYHERNDIEFNLFETVRYLSSI